MQLDFNCGGIYRITLGIALVLLFCYCNEKSDKGVEKNIRFTSLPASETGLSFNNQIVEDDTVNLIYNSYAYMGSGVGVGDFNNDGLQDVFFGANQQSSKLYVNRGGLKFEDVTEAAGLITSSWITGVSIIDINNDGLDDIYLCAANYFDPQKRKNRLFINNGNLKFTDMAAAYGLDDTSYSSQAVFFDYDKDGDLDMYLLNHYREHHNANNITKINLSGNSQSHDKLFRNNGVNARVGHPVFEEVSKNAGILEDGYGLGIAVSDVNNDGWPDIYVANDYLANDFLWLNNKNGTFTNIIGKATKHQSYSSMGVDINDINNDGLTDIISLDMMPEENYRNKMMYSFLNYDRYILERNMGYEPQFIRNMLQLNNGVRDINDTVVPYFSEVGRLAGISETDWSWSVLMADLDNDGLKDIHITNGMGRDMINSDFITYYAASVQHPVSDFKTFYSGIRNKLNEYGTVELNNYCFRNNGNLNFSDVSNVAGIGSAAVSSGCAYADFDNDGDLDLAVNNINKEVFLLRNDARKNVSDTVNNFIRVDPEEIGVTVKVIHEGKIQVAEQYPVRGYLSSVDRRLHFGIGNLQYVDSVIVIWPNQKRQLFLHVKANSVLQADSAKAVEYNPGANIPSTLLFADITANSTIDFRHKEGFYYDYGYQQLLPQKFSQLGPFITDGDINGDGLTDFFIGGARNQSGKFFIQQQNGSFISKDLENAKQQEDLGCLLFDADGDKDLDLFVNSGGNEYEAGSANYLPRLYINDGKGNFTHNKSALPQSLFTSAQVVAGADYDGDGDIDLFIGGRITPRSYPLIPTSYLLRNDGGVFSVVTQEVCPELENAGMITSAVWTDINGDKKPDLIIAGEWMPVRFFKNTGHKFTDVTSSVGSVNLNGQWRALCVADLDKDGDMDIVAGNMGLNNHYKANAEHPIKLFAKDFDGNGSVDPVMAYYRSQKDGERKLFPAITREQFAAQVPLVKKKFFYNKDYAVSDMSAVLAGTEKEDILELTCNELRTVWLENRDGKFFVHELPVEAQFAPVNAIVCTDADTDGNIDLIIAGNEYQTEVMTGRYDGSYGLLLKGDGKGNFNTVRPVQSGLIIDGDVKDVKLLTTGKHERLILAAVNDGQLKVFKIR